MSAPGLGTPPLTQLPARGLYAITSDRAATPEALTAHVAAALQGGARIIQYRAKADRQRVVEAQWLLNLCRRAGVPLIINDDVELARHINADGVHLGRDDGSVAEARVRLGASAIIGVSCYDSVSSGMVAQTEGASYVAFGRFFPSRTKPDATAASLDTLRWAKQQLHIPIVAIGGIDASNGRPLIEAGADFLAVIDGLFGQDDVEAAARRLHQLFS